jgi:hypothetical protein
VLKVESNKVIVNNLSYENNKCLSTNKPTFEIKMAWNMYKNMSGLCKSMRSQTLCCNQNLNRDTCFFLLLFL